MLSLVWGVAGVSLDSVCGLEIGSGAMRVLEYGKRGTRRLVTTIVGHRSGLCMSAGRARDLPATVRVAVFACDGGLRVLTERCL